jgi:hypothetical protein
MDGQLRAALDQHAKFANLPEATKVSVINFVENSVALHVETLKRAGTAPAAINWAAIIAAVIAQLPQILSVVTAIISAVTPAPTSAPIPAPAS